MVENSKDQDYFYITTSSDRLKAEIHCTNEYNEREITINRQTIQHLLDENNIAYGFNKDTINQLLTTPKSTQFPFVIASGVAAQDGEDGKINYAINISSEVQKTDDWNFRDVMRIPTVQNGQKLATIIPPTDGKNGIDVFNNPIRARKGRPFLMRAGKNVRFQESDQSFYATLEGQVRIQRGRIDVQPVYEVHDSLSLKTGNLDFIGSIIIHGDVPTGYNVNAGGDIKVYGIVEAANVTSEGSIYISEGLAGLQKGTVKAKENVHVGYINQGTVHAKETIFVENSILHSICEAGKDIFCQRGNIIGGSISAGQTIEARDIGNRLSTKTTISLGISSTIYKEEKKLLEKKKELQVTLRNLEMIGKKLASQENQTRKIQQTLQRQKNSYDQTAKQLEEIESELHRLTSSLGDAQKAQLVVNNYIYPNTVISFGKYQRMIQKDYRNVRILLSENEVIIGPGE